ncbi:MAG: hypothetical protein ACLUVF_05250 [Adlercreutzia sp.]
MKALVIAEHSEAARELAAGARTLADEVALVVFGEAPENVADAAYIVEVPEGAVADDAYLTIQSIYDKEQPAVLLAEPTRHVKSVLGRLAAAAGAAAITDVTAFEDGGALSLYFGGVGERVRKAAGDVAFYTVVPGTFADAEPAGRRGRDRGLDRAGPSAAPGVLPRAREGRRRSVQGRGRRGLRPRVRRESSSTWPARWPTRRRRSGLLPS